MDTPPAQRISEANPLLRRLAWGRIFSLGTLLVDAKYFVETFALFSEAFPDFTKLRHLSSFYQNSLAPGLVLSE
jgi:hypothetical protein